MGIVSAKNRHLEGETSLQNFIQTDAAINPGNSGGALINARGELIGVNTMILTGGGASFGGEAGNIGIGFAVPSNMAKQVMDQIIKNGKVSRGYLGVNLQNVTTDNAPLLGLKDDKGAVIADVTPNGPGAKAGLKAGDVITGFNGHQVQGMEDLTMDVVSEAPGSTVTLDVVRDGKPMKVTATLGTRRNDLNWTGNNGNGNNGNNGDNDQDNNNGNVSLRGLTVETLTPDLAQQVGVPASIKGVVVDDVDQASPAGGVPNLGRGTVIVAVNRHPIANTSDFKREMAASKSKAVLLTVDQGGTNLFVVLPAE
jgi:serine protease Do